ncbi:MAG: ferritin-like domain-containing protein [Polyangiaceae bacterium]
MPLRDLNVDATTSILNAILEHELAGVVRYTHYALMVTGPNRIPIVQFMNGQAQESLLHAQQVGELLTGLEGHPSMRIATIVETNEHSTRALLQESLNHELEGVAAYKKLLEIVENASVYLEEFTRGMIGQEERHQIELKKMLRDYGQD